MKDIKIRLWNTDDCNKYKSNPGNGKHVKQYELDSKTHLLKEKLDEAGECVFHNLYDDIQAFKDSNNLEKILKVADQQTVENLSILTDNPAFVDTTNLMNAEKIKDMENKYNSTFADLQARIIKLQKEYTEQLEKLNKVKNDSNSKVENKEVINNGENKK